MYKIQNDVLQIVLQIGITRHCRSNGTILQTHANRAEKRDMSHNNLFGNQRSNPRVRVRQKHINSPTHQRQSVEKKEDEDHHEASQNDKLYRFYNKCQEKGCNEDEASIEQTPREPNMENNVILVFHVQLE